MPAIKETLVLEDRFSSSLTSYIKMMENGQQTTEQTKAAMRQVNQEARLLASAYKNTAAQSKAEEAQTKAQIAAKRLETQEMRAQREAQRLMNAEMKQGTTAANNLVSSIKGVVGAFIGLQGIKAVVNLSDSIASVTSRLDLMNDGLQTTAELNNMIFQSAQRSRGAYLETANLVTQLGMMAGDAFSSSQEIVAFAELLNKQLVISGANGASASAAIFQLQQALASGVLRGEELNSVLEQAPVIAQTIADYLGVSIGELRELGSQGAITADVVKNAMFAAADETNAKFAEMPMTWSQVFTTFKNTAIQTFEPILNVVGKLAQVTAENLDVIGPAFYGAAAAAIFFATATTIANGSLATFAATLMATPLGWIALLLGIVVMATIQWIQSLGGVEIAWLTVKNSALTMLETIQLGIMTFVTNAANGFGNLKVQVLMNFQEMVNGAIDGSNKLVSFANQILGTSFGMMDHISIGTEAALENTAAQAARNADLSKLKAGILANRLSRSVEIASKKAETASGTGDAYNYNGQSELTQIASDIGDIKGSTSKIAKDVDMSNEDIKSLVDVATRQYINKINLTSQTPIINVNGQNSGDTQADRKALADKLRDIILEQAASSSYRPTSMPT